jgi:hypothetical protein
MRSSSQVDHHHAAWFFGGLILVFLLCVFVFGPDELPPYKHNLLGVFCSALCGFFGYFFTGTIKLVSKGEYSKGVRISIQAGGGFALFLIGMIGWKSNVNPIREIGPIADQTEFLLALRDAESYTRAPFELLGRIASDPTNQCSDRAKAKLSEIRGGLDLRIRLLITNKEVQHIVWRFQWPHGIDSNRPPLELVEQKVSAEKEMLGLLRLLTLIAINTNYSNADRFAAFKRTYNTHQNLFALRGVELFLQKMDQSLTNLPPLSFDAINRWFSENSSKYTGEK